MHPTLRAAIALFVALFALPASANFHLWAMNELYSNADGSVQFLELTALSSQQEFLNGHTLQATGGGTTRTFTFPTNLPGDTQGHRMLNATQGFAALGVVSPDYIVPNGFFTATGGTITFAEGSDVWTYPVLPSPPLSLNRDGTTATNSPTNFGGASGTISSTPVATFNVQALWWKSPALSENGWGLNLVQQGNTLFGTWYTYDNDGSDLWLFMDNLTLTGNNTYSGNVLRATAGSPFGVEPYDNARFEASVIGNATLAFTDADHGTFTYTVNGISNSKAIIKFVYTNPVPVCVTNGAAPATPNYQDLWWRSPARSENGVGYNIIHQGNILFVTWFTYDVDGTQMWLFMDNAAKQPDNSYQGNVYQAHGSPGVAATPYDPARFGAVQVGTGTFRFSDANSGTFSYTVKGFTQIKPITRFVFGATQTTCSTETTTMDPMDNGGYGPR